MGYPIPRTEFWFKDFTHTGFDRTDVLCILQHANGVHFGRAVVTGEMPGALAIAKLSALDTARDAALEGKAITPQEYVKLTIG